MFLRRGVSLQEDSLPYLEILEETFSRAAMLERENASARTALSRLEENSRRFADSCQEMYGQLRSMEDFLGLGQKTSPHEAGRRRRLARQRAAALRAKTDEKLSTPDRPFFVILSPSEPE
jgi:septal ring factor EnvC (AmiA/AmiB activator)